jgi:hypothetical protein
MFIEKINPLSVEHTGNEEVLINVKKLTVKNILNSYVGWYDPFCELIQNGLDAIDERILLEETDYTPMIKIHINIKKILLL